jgi:hypothetical protein
MPNCLRRDIGLGKINLGIPYAALIWNCHLRKETDEFCFPCLRHAELISHIRKEVEEGNLPADVATSLEELYYNYKNAVKTAELDLG